MHSLAITEQGTKLHLQGESLLVMRGTETLRRVRLGELRELLLLGQIDLSTAALAALARRNIDVVFLTQYGTFRARLVGRASPQAALRLTQLRRALDPAFCLTVARAIIHGKITHQRQILLRAQRRLRDETLAGALGQMRLLGEEALRVDDLERQLGMEGQAAALYFAHLGKLLRRDDLAFEGRSRRPPRDPVNACLSFGYVLFGTMVESEVLRCGLDPLLGFLHQPHHGRASLALDLVEEFRPLVDTLVLRLINRRQLGPVDFEQRGVTTAEILAEEPPEEHLAEDAPDPAASEHAGVYLAGPGRRIFLTEFFARLRERLFYPPRQGSFELREIVRQQVYQLARVIEGHADAYVPFVPGQ